MSYTCHIRSHKPLPPDPQEGEHALLMREVLHYRVEGQDEAGDFDDDPFEQGSGMVYTLHLVLFCFTLKRYKCL